MKRSMSLTVFAITLITMGGMAPRVRAQQPSAAQPPSTTPPRSATASLLGVFVYPKNNQDSGQQAKDESECYNSAKQQSGIDPTAPPPPPQDAQKAKGGGAKGAAGGAAAGAAVGAVAGDAGQGAAIGATAGAIKGRREQKKANKQAEQQAQQKAQAQSKENLATFNKAFGACMDARQYSVK